MKEKEETVCSLQLFNERLKSNWQELTNDFPYHHRRNGWEQTKEREKTQWVSRRLGYHVSTFNKPENCWYRAFGSIQHRWQYNDVTADPHNEPASFSVCFFFFTVMMSNKFSHVQCFETLRRGVVWGGCNSSQHCRRVFSLISTISFELFSAMLTVAIEDGDNEYSNFAADFF